MLEVDGVRFAYPRGGGAAAAEAAGAEIRADFCIPTGRAAALMGASGAGKSTVIHLIAGLLTPDRGDMRFAGRGLLGAAPADRPLTCLLQTGNLFAHLPVWQNIAIGLHPGLRVDAAGRRAIDAALDWVSLTGLGARKPSSLSGGQRRRVALARCLARDRPLLLLDEPFSGLDDDLRADMLALIRGLQAERGTTVLCATHRLADAESLQAEVIRVRGRRAATQSAAAESPGSTVSTTVPPESTVTVPPPPINPASAGA
ncbi:MAG: ATP-binding cassette domain-containing protein [Gammaproteobacteria bacterium]|nr:ATP-binding cassette domain-containing protein [Gammaproteobacteria bacterium]